MKNFQKSEIRTSKTSKFRFVCKHWSVCFGFQCLFTFFWCKHKLFWKIFENLKSELRKLRNFALFANIGLFVLVSSVYLHFFDVNTNCFEKFSKIWNRNFEKFEISLCLQTLVRLFWFSVFIYIFLIVCFGFQCLFTFFWCKHKLFWKIFENLKSELRKLRNFALFANIGLFVLVSSVYLHFFDCLFWLFIYIFGCKYTLF